MSNLVWEEVYREFFPKVQNYLSAHLPNFGDVEEVTDDVMLKVFRALPGFDPGKSNISTWIYRISRNTLIDFYRTKKEEPLPLSEEPLMEEVGEERLEVLAEALQTLPLREKRVIVLYYYQNFSLKEIAAHENLSYAGVKLLHKKARESLKAYLEAAQVYG